MYFYQMNKDIIITFIIIIIIIIIILLLLLMTDWGTHQPHFLQSS